jgi:SAM-dependent methyltransferase
MIMFCRVCQGRLGTAIYHAHPPSLTSLSTLADVPTEVFVCTRCGHGQSINLPNVGAFYDTHYRISLDSEGHDQLYAIVDGHPIYRTDRQAELVILHANPPHGARVLDYGAAKAATLRNITTRRPDLVPYVFDVSTDYVDYWKSWVAPERCATYSVPESWNALFDLVTVHFVLEHAVEPVMLLRDVRRVLKKGGTLFLSVPNPIQNPGDLIVVDHANHFSEASLRRALRSCGFDEILVDSEGFGGAFVVVAKALEVVDADAVDVTGAVCAFTDIGKFWSQADARLGDIARLHKGTPSAVYGAGVYGSFIAARIGEIVNLVAFVDRNPHVRLRPHLGRDVLKPEDLPAAVKVVYAGLNPKSARAILADVPEWRGRSLDFVFLDTHT